MINHSSAYLSVVRPWSRWLLKIAVVSMMLGILASLVLLEIWPGTLGLAIGLALIAARPHLSDHIARSLRHQPSASLLSRLAAEADLQRSVFLVARELADCMSTVDCSRRFAQALQSYWDFTQCECWLWERGQWHLLGASTRQGQGLPDGGEAPNIQAPVCLPGEEQDWLILDLSPAVSGQAAVVLRQARAQPSLLGHSQNNLTALAETLRAQLALTLRRSILHRDLQALARIDPLTGTDRRWYGMQRLIEGLEEQGVTLAMLDIDHFKRVNDQFGHLVGDQVLSKVGRILRQHLRPGDSVFRYGGEEFVVVLLGLNQTAGAAVIQRLLDDVAAIPREEMGLSVSLSAGCTQGQVHEDPDAVLERADAACYQAKQQGRNRMVVG